MLLLCIQAKKFAFIEFRAVVLTCQLMVQYVADEQMWCSNVALKYSNICTELKAQQKEKNHSK